MVRTGSCCDSLLIPCFEDQLAIGHVPLYDGRGLVMQPGSGTSSMSQRNIQRMEELDRVGCDGPLLAITENCALALFVSEDLGAATVVLCFV